MKGFGAFFRKEWLEYTRSYKLFALFMVFAALGVMNPPAAKFLPEIFAAALGDAVQLKLPEPVVLDSWTQFFKNVPQIGLLLALLMFSPMLSSEISKGTLVQILTKGMPRYTVFWVKWLFAVGSWSVCYVLAFAVTYLYNLVFWDTGGAPKLVWAAFMVWCYGILLFCFLFLGSLLLKSTAGGLLGVLVVFGGGMVLSLFPAAEKYSPSKLVLDTTQLLSESGKAADFFPGILVALVLCGVSLAVSLLVFKRSSL